MSKVNIQKIQISNNPTEISEYLRVNADKLEFILTHIGEDNLDQALLKEIKQMKKDISEIKRKLGV